MHETHFESQRFSNEISTRKQRIYNYLDLIDDKTKAAQFEFLTQYNTLKIFKNQRFNLTPEGLKDQQIGHQECWLQSTI
jgi:hypothetical protein